MSNRIFFLLFIIVCPAYTFAQVEDASLWTSLSVEKKITRKLSAQIAQEFRLNENVSELGSLYSNLGFDYKIHRNINVSLQYRFIQNRRLDDSYSKRHRYYADVQVRQRIQKFSILFRVRYQMQFNDVYSSEDGLVPSYILRNKLTARYKFNKRIEPFISGEIYLQSMNPEGNSLDKIRYSGGVEYEINKNHSVELFYLIQEEKANNNPERDYVTGLGYSYSF